MSSRFWIAHCCYVKDLSKTSALFGIYLKRFLTDLAGAQCLLILLVSLAGRNRSCVHLEIRHRSVNCKITFQDNANDEDKSKRTGHVARKLQIRMLYDKMERDKHCNKYTDKHPCQTCTCSVLLRCILQLHWYLSGLRVKYHRQAELAGEADTQHDRNEQ